MKPLAVIGAGFGDEGKGALVDALSHPDACVVRFNGGAQAGHTVEVAGRRHVFHHFGAGSFRGASTHLSRFFVCNPILALLEIEALNVPMSISVDPLSPVTTPVDMMINQALEMSRTKRHGSCGLGFGETWERHESGFPVTMGDVYRSPEQTLDRVIEEWLPRRCQVLGLDRDRLPLHDGVMASFLDDWRMFASLVRLRDDSAVTGPVIFEGAQGLALDQDLGVFPHVTRSYTGSPNISKLADDMGFDDIDVYYAVRSYATRHGAGPLPREDEWVGSVPEDLTNVKNSWQGQLRCAPWDVGFLSELIRADCARASIGWSPSLFVSCIDQVGWGQPELDRFGEALTQPVSGYAQGPERKDRFFF